MMGITEINMRNLSIKKKPARKSSVLKSMIELREILL
jgi:hypothetical protein